MSKRIDMTGHVFGRLTVQRFDRNESNQSLWVCLCECGNTVSVRRGDLKREVSRSCGCLRAEVAARRATRHGMCGTTEYNIWCGMIQRCHEPRTKAYEYYGGRGITVCDRWRESIHAFYEDMGPRPHGKSIDRVNNDGNYEPSNCRWATHIEQMRNTRRSKSVRTAA